VTAGSGPSTGPKPGGRHHAGHAATDQEQEEGRTPDWLD
jgi:hypothetical protein